MARHPRTPGIECSNCGCRMSTVVESHKHEVMYRGAKRTIIKRYRRCRHCKCRYTTIETLEDNNNVNLPDGIDYFKDEYGLNTVPPPRVENIRDAWGHAPIEPPTDEGQGLVLPPKKRRQRKRKP